ncbi:hypothetical protein V9T40_001133 [Parthenolecanium corni]|uniref:Uncharacterized protein n=1 Tax=Parthenolecanium corni TaxID=536013 RepID=A0AAN9TCD1_9HEMI
MCQWSCQSPFHPVDPPGHSVHSPHLATTQEISSFRRESRKRPYQHRKSQKRLNSTLKCRRYHRLSNMTGHRIGMGRGELENLTKSNLPFVFKYILHGILFYRSDQKKHAQSENEFFRNQNRNQDLEQKPKPETGSTLAKRTRIDPNP